MLLHSVHSDAQNCRRKSQCKDHILSCVRRRRRLVLVLVETCVGDWVCMLSSDSWSVLGPILDGLKTRESQQMNYFVLCAGLFQQAGSNKLLSYWAQLMLCATALAYLLVTFFDNCMLMICQHNADLAPSWGVAVSTTMSFDLPFLIYLIWCFRGERGRDLDPSEMMRHLTELTSLFIYWFGCFKGHQLTGGFANH